VGMRHKEKMSVILDKTGFGVPPMFHFCKRMNGLKRSTTIWWPWAACSYSVIEPGKSLLQEGNRS
jgi:hypothetical protein